MADDYREDRMIWPTAVELLGCVQAELTASGRPVGQSTIAYGDQPPALDLGDDCDGFLWVRIATGFPSSQFPNQDIIAGTAGVMTPMAFSLEVAVARCVTIAGVDEDGNVLQGQPIPQADIFEDARAQAADISAVYRGICKCFSGTDTEYVIAGMLVQGPLGSINLSGWDVSVAWDPGL